jgi:hypothetical protein
MIRGRGVVTMAPIAVLGLVVAACSSGGGTAKVSSKALCENAGGRYAQGTCQPGTAKKANEMCEGFGGIFFVQEDLCHITTK